MALPAAHEQPSPVLRERRGGSYKQAAACFLRRACHALVWRVALP